MEIVGNVERFDLVGSALELNTAFAKLRITQYGPSCFRIQACKQREVFQTSTYACPELPEAELISYAQQGDDLVIATSVVRLRVHTKPFRVRFETLDGKVISEDDPGLGIVWDGDEVTNYRSIQPGERFMGLGEKTGPLDKAGIQLRNWNTDAFGYQKSTDPLYASCPFFIGLSHERPYGIFFNSQTETVFNFGAANDRFSFFQAPSGQLDYFFFAGPEPADILRDYSALTGRTPMPPMWSLGFQQCRYSYYPDTEVLRVAKTFRELAIPADVIYFDIHYMQDYKVFTWHKERFPEPEKLIAELKAMGFKVVVILDPGVKAEEGYEVFDEGNANDAFIKYPDGKPYLGEAWPGWCKFPDFTSAAVRTWWGSHVAKFVDMGVDGFWNDMNEFAVWGKATPKLIQYELEGEKGSEKEAHNVYGMQMARATAEGARKGLGKRRPFILTRATFAGGQRDSALWTGDNFSNDEHLLLGSRMVSGLGLSGFPFTGNDIGGFTGDATPALYMRWVAHAAFHPLMRAHTMINSKSAEPWAFGEECTEVVRNYIRLRYQMLPHMYSLFYEASLNGMPPVRSLVFRFHSEWKIFTADFQNQFMLGEHLLVCPVGADVHIAKVYLPKGKWYRLFNDLQLEGAREHLLELYRDNIPVFVQAGGIIPMQGVVQHTGEAHDGVLRLHVYTGGNGTYSFYEDDGVSTSAEHCMRKITLTDNVLVIGKAEGGFASAYHTWRVYLHGYEGEQVAVDGESQKLKRANFRFMEAISNFDPYESYPDGEKLIKDLASLDLEMDVQEVQVRLN